MTGTRRLARLILPCAVLAAAVPRPGAAQAADDSLVSRPLATRAELEALVQRLASNSSQHAQAVVGRAQARLTDGDFRSGDRILLEVQGEPALTDTFVVGATGALALPPPTVGATSLHGVLRSELEPFLTQYVGRFVQNAQVQARALIRLSIQGEVTRAGVYGIPADAKVADALMAAGGTTQYANMKKLRIEREGGRVSESPSVDRALDDFNLKDGDQIVVGTRRPGVNDGLRFVWLIVSIAGGVYGLSRAFH